MIALVAMCACAVALVAFATSALVHLGLRAAAGALDRIGGTARARLLLAATLAPMLVSVSALAIALGPSFGLGADHCGGHGAHHPHLCVAHRLDQTGALVFALAIAFGVRIAVGLTRSVVLALRARGAARELSSGDDVQVIDLAAPQAFVTGLWRPRVFVTRALANAVSGDELAVVLAHEEAHARRRDPLRRIVAIGALAFHLPFFARELERRLAVSHELAADEEAARTVGDPTRVASTIVRLARLRLAGSADVSAAAPFSGPEITERVSRLLAGPSGVDAPSRALVLVVFAVVALAGVAGADHVHHLLETLIGLAS